MLIACGANPSAFSATEALASSITRECPLNGTLKIDLAGFFNDTAISGPVVEVTTNAPLAQPSFFIELFDDEDQSPLSAANFLAYVRDSSYDGSFFHKSVGQFLIQGGGFKTPTVPADQQNSDPTAITSKGAIANEPGTSNLRGTVAMAKPLGGGPDSATSQWFINLGDNSFLDTQDSGSTVFGQVLGTGMTVVDSMATALTYDASTYYNNAELSDLPLWAVNGDNIVRPEDFVHIETILEGEALIFSYSVDVNAAVGSVSGSILSIDCAATGTPKTVVVQAQSKLDNSTANLNISLIAPPVDPAILWFITRPTELDMQD
jgi:cyclophilin family peptidyl-prolyl cis-trans isomerase